MSAGKGLVGATIGRLRHPWLFTLAATALVADLLIPDMIPFVDELLIAAATAGLALLRKRREDASDEAPADSASEAG